MSFFKFWHDLKKIIKEDPHVFAFFSRLRTTGGCPLVTLLIRVIHILCDTIFGAEKSEIFLAFF